MPTRRKLKRESSTEEADAKLAAQLQAQENILARGRTTRGGGSTKLSKKAKPAAKKKSAKRVRDDDSEAGSGDEEKGAKRKAGGGFQKPFNLSYPLAELCGESQVSLANGVMGGPKNPPKADVSIDIAFAPPGRQEVVGAYQGQRAPGPQRQAANSLR